MKDINNEKLIVMTKYVKGGKQVVIYDQSSKICWIEEIVDGKTRIIKTFGKDN